MDAATSNRTPMPYRFHYPLPRPEGIEKARLILTKKYGREVDSSEAAEVLTRTMRFLYLSAHPEGRPPVGEEIPDHSEPPKKSKRGKPASLSRRTS